MNNILKITIISFYALLSVSVAAAAPRVVVTVPAVRSIYEEILGAPLTVIKIASGDPHSIDITPSQIAAALSADLVVLFGAPYESQLGKLSRSLKTVSSTTGYSWINPKNIEQSLSSYLAELCKLDKNRCGTYQYRFNNVIVGLISLSIQLKEKFAPHKNSTINALHPAFGEFALLVGLSERILLPSGEGGELSPKVIAELINLAAPPTIYIEKGSSVSTLPSPIKVTPVDVLGHDAKSYAEFINQVADTFLKGLQ